MKFFKNFNRVLIFRKRYKRAVNVIAMIVVFATTYALILPAITLDQDKAEKSPGVTLTSPTNQEGNAENFNTTNASSDPEALDAEQPVLGTDTSIADQVMAESQVEAANEASEVEANSETVKSIEEETIMTHQGQGYELTAQFTAEAKLPQGVELIVKQLDPQSPEYKTHYDKTKEALGAKTLSYARFFDISFLYQNEEVEPQAPVQIKIKNEEAVRLSRESKLKVVHFEKTNQVEVIKATTDETDKQISEISFESTSFSVFGDVAADYYTVKFVYADHEGGEEEITTLIDIAEGATIQSLPDEPFKSGSQFSHWRDKETGETVTVDTPVTKDMVVEAVFTEIDIFTITVNYYYHNNSSGQDVIFDTEIFQLDADDVTYRITPPPSTKVYRTDDPSLPSDAVYYPERPLIEITKEMLEDFAGQENKEPTINLQFVPYTAEYDFIYMLKDLTGDGYSQIDKVHAYGLLGSTITPQVLAFDYADFEKTEPVEITTKEGQELKVYYTRKSYTLNYRTNGGSYIAPQTDLYQTKLPITSEVPTREGYTFAGWYDNKELKGDVVTGTVELDSDKTLYAKWEPKTVPYTIVYYKEVYDNVTQTTKYVYDSSRNATAKVGTTVQANDAPAIQTVLPYHEKDGVENEKSSVDIVPDGSSVLKVYYKLKRYTFKFDLKERDQRYRLTMNGQTYHGNGTMYEITDVVLGRDVSAQWPSAVNEVYDSKGEYGFNGWKSVNTTRRYLTRRNEVTPEMLEGADQDNVKVFTADWEENLIDKQVEYYLQSPDDPSHFDLSPLSQSYKSKWNNNLNQKEFAGFTKIEGTPEGQRDHDNKRIWIEQKSGYESVVTTYRFYYERNTYTIDYYYKDNLVKSTGQEIPFESNINTPTYNYIPQRPANVDSDYTWGGWYADEELKTPYDFTIMPPNNLVLYANWQAPVYPVSFDLNGGEGTPPDTQQVEKYKTASAPAEPSREHYDFDGWYTEPVGGSLYDWAKPVTKETKLYARWKLKPLTYTVKYLEEGTNSPVATEKVVTSPAFTPGQSITENALAITGYRPDSREKTIQLDFANNVITFYYAKKAADIDYTVKYVLATDPSVEVAQPVTKTAKGSTIRVKETAVSVDKSHFATQTGVTADMLAKGYYPVSNVKTLVLSSNEENNVIVFEYRDFETAKILVNYLDMDGNPIPGQVPTVAYRKKTSSYVVDQKAISGYTYDHSADNRGGANKRVYRISSTDDLIIDLYYQKDLVIEAIDKEKVYDSTALGSDGLGDVKDSYQGLLEAGDFLDTISYTGSQTDVGKSSTTPEAAIIKSGNKDRTYYYNIQYKPATLTVTQQPIAVYIEADRLEKIYDGKAASISYSIKEIDDANGLYKETYIQFNGSDSDKKLTQTDAGTYQLNLQNRFTNTNPNFKVDFYVSDGELSIHPRQLTLVSDSGSKAYDGTVLTASNVIVKVADDVDYTGFVDGEGVEIDYTGSQTQPGTSQNTFDYKAKANTNLANYDIDTQFGQLMVTETVNIQKTMGDWTALVGGKFEVTKWDGINWSAIKGLDEVSISSTEGVNLPVGLEPGRYRIRETAAPDGFVVLDSFVYFTIIENVNEDDTASYYTVSLTDEEGNTSSPDKANLLGASGNYSHRIQIANEQGRALPHTGGEGRKFFIISGLLLISLVYPLHRLVQNRSERRLDN